VVILPPGGGLAPAVVLFGGRQLPKRPDYTWPQVAFNDVIHIFPSRAIVPVWAYVRGALAR